MTTPFKLAVICFSFSLILSHTSAHASTIPEDKKLLIEQILEQTGTTKVISLMTNQLSGEILNILKKKNVPLDQNLVTLVQNEAKTVMHEEFIQTNKFNQIFYELYDQHFSLEQLKDLVKFYASSTGKQLLIAMPDISRQSMMQAQEHSKDIGSKVLQALMKRFDEHEKQRDQAKADATGK